MTPSQARAAAQQRLEQAHRRCYLALLAEREARLAGQLAVRDAQDAACELEAFDRGQHSAAS
jgi:hypothetical protein